MPQRVLTSKDYAQGLRATINPEKATPSDLLSGNPTPLEDDETTHFSIIDGEGNRVGATQTVNLLYGSGLIPKGTGVLLNDEMDDFALKPGTPNAFGVMGYAANAPKPGKRMLSSMTPTFMESADKVAVIGTPGGSRIITMVLLGILGYDAGLDAQQVSALPRYHHQWLPDVIEAESNAFSPQTVKALQTMGHALKLPGDTAAGGRGSSHVWGNLQTVEWDKRSNAPAAAATRVTRWARRKCNWRRRRVECGHVLYSHCEGRNTHVGACIVTQGGPRPTLRCPQQLGSGACANTGAIAACDQLSLK